MTEDRHHQDSPFEPEKQAEFVVGALVGALVGGAAALLLTPKNGQEMRTLVKEYAKEWENEAYQLAKEGRTVTKSLRQALEEGTASLAEAAPQKIDQATQQAQHLASTFEHHLETARDTVSEIAEAFRSGWEEYGEEVVTVTTTKLEIPDVLAPQLDQDESDQSDQQHTAPHHPLQSRRRSHTTHHYAMHSAKADQAHQDQSVSTPSPAKNKGADSQSDSDSHSAHQPMLASHPATPASSSPARPYTTRILEQAQPEVSKEVKSTARSRTVKVEVEEAKPAKETSKKLFFRRGA